MAYEIQVLTDTRWSRPTPVVWQTSIPRRYDALVGWNASAEFPSTLNVDDMKGITDDFKALNPRATVRLVSDGKVIYQLDNVENEGGEGIQMAITVPKPGVRIKFEDLRAFGAEITTSMPTKMRKPAKEVLADPQMNEGVTEMVSRASEFSSPMAAMLAGIWMVPAARKHMDDALDAMWLEKPGVGAAPIEAVIGGGLQAAVYCAMRVAQGFPPPLVLESRDRVGGVFAISQGPSFYLNSRNRPGQLSVPGDYSGSLNYIPGAPVQPADLSGEEFHSNDVMGWIIRMTLGLNAKVVHNAEVAYISRLSMGEVRVTFKNGQLRALKVGRAVIADGLAKPKDVTVTDAGSLRSSPRVLTFEDFMVRMDEPFPLRGMNRVAVVGAGDAGKTAIEALTGLGPQPHMSVASLDYPRMIEWFGVPIDQRTRQDWEKCNRSRYLRIGSLLPDRDDSRKQPRVKLGDKQPSYYGLGYDCILVDSKPFDYLIDCTGYNGQELYTSSSSGAFRIGNRTVAKKLAAEIYQIGVAANIEVGATESLLIKSIAENSTSMFRYSGRTAALAMSLPEVSSFRS